MKICKLEKDVLSFEGGDWRRPRKLWRFRVSRRGRDKKLIFIITDKKKKDKNVEMKEKNEKGRIEKNEY